MDRRVLRLAVAALASAGLAGGDGTAVAGTKLIVVDGSGRAGNAKTVFTLEDEAVTKGSGTDVTSIDAVLDVAFDGAHGVFVAPAGPGWVANRAAVATYRNAFAPLGGVVRAVVVKPGRLAKLVANGLGDVPLDVSVPPGGSVYAGLTVTNGGESTRLCVRFDDCVLQSAANGTRRRLVCRTAAADPACLAVPSTTTTSTTVTTTSSVAPTTTTLEVMGSIDCCQGTGTCVGSLGFSLNFYLYSYCSTVLPGSTGVPGGACQADGTCEVQTIDPPRDLCCQLPDGTCYDTTVPVTDTAQVWSFRNYCVGGYLGTTYADAMCGADGACAAE